MGKGGIGVDVSAAEKREGHDKVMKSSAAGAARAELKKALAADGERLAVTRTKTKSAFSDLSKAYLMGDHDVHDDAAFKTRVRSTGNPVLDNFRREYDQLQRALRTCLEKEGVLLSECRKLKDKLYENVGRLQMAVKLKEEDAKTITQLRREISTAPNVLRCSVTYWVSSSSNPPAINRATRCTSATFDASRTV